jgi:hypothetical protein
MLAKSSIPALLAILLIAPRGARAETQGKLVDRLASAVEKYAAGFESVGQAKIKHLSKKSSTSFNVSVEQGFCYRFFVAGEKDAFKLEMRVSRAGSVVGETAAPYPVGFVDSCASTSGLLDVVVTNNAFGGDFIFATYRIKPVKTPGKNELGSRLKALADRHVPGGKLVAAPKTALLEKGKSFGLSFKASAGICYKVVAVGGSGVDDLGLEVRIGGQVVSQDSTTGDHPIVEHCPGTGATLEALVRTVQGSGAVIAAAFEAPASTVLVGADDAKTALHQRLESEASIYAADMPVMGIFKDGDIVNKKPVTYPLTLSKGVCYKFIAVGGSGISDLDITLRKAKTKGKKGVLAGDTTTDDAPVASYCAEISGPATVELSSKGSGMYSYAVYAGASEEAGATGVYAELSEELKQATADLGKGWKPSDTMKTAVIGDDAAADFDFEMDKGYCYSLVVVGLGGLGDLDATVTSEGIKLASAAKPGARLDLEVCPEKDLVATLKVGSHSGHGPVAFRPFRSESEVDQVFVPVGGLGSSYVAKAIRKLHAKEGKERPAVSEFLEGNLTTAKTETFELELKGGLCYTVLAVGVPSVKDLEVTLLSPLGEEVAHVKAGGPKAVVHTSPCPKWSGTYKLGVKMFAGYGNFGVQVFGK